MYLAEIHHVVFIVDTSIVAMRTLHPVNEGLIYLLPKYVKNLVLTKESHDLCQSSKSANDSCSDFGLMQLFLKA